MQNLIQYMPVAMVSDLSFFWKNDSPKKLNKSIVCTSKKSIACISVKLYVSTLIN